MNDRLKLFGQRNPYDLENSQAVFLRLMRDERLRTRLGAQGRARVVAHFDVHRTFADLEACLGA